MKSSSSAARVRAFGYGRWKTIGTLSGPRIAGVSRQATGPAKTGLRARTWRGAILAKRATSTVFRVPETDMQDAHYIAEWTAMLAGRVEALR